MAFVLTLLCLDMQISVPHLRILIMWFPSATSDSKNIGICFTAVHPSTSSSTALSQLLFTIFRETCDHNDLLSFSLLESARVSTNPDIFKPLYTCHNFKLTQLLVEHSWDISMADEELCQLVRGWPKLQVHNISRFVAASETTIPTFRGLISLLQLCPVLTSPLIPPYRFQIPWWRNLQQPS
ncbi:hypothetical protein P692DRAFT_20837774 [Suillus brevipes Sb2]|jgi:hypothetical protein|nr:hypothetical protein P692DRAFT_20837774 [Suillus brevipes Sb2]